MSDNYVKGKDKNQLLSEMVGTAQPGSEIWEQQRMAIIVRCTEDVEKGLDAVGLGLKSHEDSMNRNAASNDLLAKRLQSLNVILTVATVVGSVAAIVGAAAALIGVLGHR